VEPGLYFGAEDSDAPSWCRGIGIRIEDDVLITAAAGEVLSCGVPKEAGAVEELMHRELA
jgi:Xaa-Pro aminopeptidase